MRNTAAAVAVLVAGLATGAEAQEAPSLDGKTVRLIIGSGVGGGYDAWGRLVANHMGEHLPGNPDIVPENMPGAGSLIAANYIYSQAPEDGTVFGIIARDAALETFLGNDRVEFDATEFTWIGSTTTETNVCFAGPGREVDSVEALRTKSLAVGDTGPGTGSYKYPRALNEILDLNFEIVSGYPSSADVALAIERGEVDGMCESYGSLAARKPEWIEDGSVAFLLQSGTEPDPALPDVPLVRDLARNAEERQAISFLYAGQFFGRPFVAPPGLDEAETKMLRDAFEATMQDPDFLAEAERLQLDLAPVSGEALQAFVEELADTPPEVVQRVVEIAQ